MYTPRVILDLLGFAAVFILILFGITVVGVGGFFFVRMIGENLRAKPFRAFEGKARAAIQAADLGWVAIACGPLLGLFLSFAIILPVTLALSLTGANRDPDGAMSISLILTGLGLVAGVILASAFWVSSALLGKVRKAAKRRGGVRDPDFDGPV